MNKRSLSDVISEPSWSWRNKKEDARQSDFVKTGQVSGTFQHEFQYCVKKFRNFLVRKKLLGLGQVYSDTCFLFRNGGNRKDMYVFGGT